MESVGDRIRKARKNAKLTQEKLAKVSGVSQTTIANLESGRNADSKWLPEIANGLGLTLEQLRYGAEVNEAPAKYQPTAKAIPLISWVQAGEWGSIVDNYGVGDAEDWLPAPTNMGPRSFALVVSGDSMTSPYPGGRSYPKGMIIYVDPDHPGPFEGKRVIARRDGEATFKEFVSDGGTVYLRPLNPQFPTIQWTDESEIIGVVVASYLPE